MVDDNSLEGEGFLNVYAKPRNICPESSFPNLPFRKLGGWSDVKLHRSGVSLRKTIAAADL
jgi:hypothetical protein